VLIISYATRELADRCTKLEVAQEWLGAVKAQALIDLIADAEAMEHAKALIAFYSAQCPAGGLFSISLDSSLLVLFGPATQTFSKTPDGKPNWAQIRRLLLNDIQEL